MSGDSASSAKPLFLGGHLALDFLNTTMSPQGTEIELIGDGRAFVDWLVAAQAPSARCGSSIEPRPIAAGSAAPRCAGTATR
jgi:hypothetical protein